MTKEQVREKVRELKITEGDNEADSSGYLPVILAIIAIIGLIIIFS